MLGLRRTSVATHQGSKFLQASRSGLWRPGRNSWWVPFHKLCKPAGNFIRPKLKGSISLHSRSD